MVKDRSDNKLYAIDELIDAIGDKFGSLEEYAKTKGLTKQTISAKIRTQSRKFIKALKQDGIIIDSSFNRGNNSGGDSIVGQSGTAIAKLEGRIELLKEQHKELLEENAKLRVEIAELKRKK